MSIGLFGLSAAPREARRSSRKTAQKPHRAARGATLVQSVAIRLRLGKIPPFPREKQGGTTFRRLPNRLELAPPEREALSRGTPRALVTGRVVRSHSGARACAAPRASWKRFGCDSRATMYAFARSWSWPAAPSQLAVSECGRRCASPLSAALHFRECTPDLAACTLRDALARPRPRLLRPSWRSRAPAGASPGS